MAPTILDVLGVSPLPVENGQSLAPYLVGLEPASPRDHIFSQYLDNEEAYIRTDRYKFIYCSGARARTDQLQPAGNPTPGPYVRLYDLYNDPNEFTDISAAPSSAALVAQFEQMLLDRFMQTDPLASKVPASYSVVQKLDYFLVPRDA